MNLSSARLDLNGCVYCGWTDIGWRRNIDASVMYTRNLIELYFHMGLTYDDITWISSIKHNIKISVRHLKRTLRELKLTRRKGYSDLDSVLSFIECQLITSGQMHGYRWMYQKCLLNGLKVKKEEVRLLLELLDPQGVELRQRRCLRRRHYFSKGPNYCWHIDSYDKLKPYGLCINGCIDGYSRKLIWLKVGRSNSDPKVIAKYFIDAVEEYGGCPTFMRGDMGTENVRVAAMQRFFRRSDGRDIENDRTFIYGKSTLNTRIESWWGILRKECCQIWMEELKVLRDTGLFTGNALDINLVQFCLMRLLQDELDDVMMVWNTHRIRASRNNSPSGRPLILHLLPDMENVEDHLCDVSEEEIEVCRMECAVETIYPCEEELFELCCPHMEENNWNLPKAITEAIDLYLRLRNWLITQL